MRLTPSFVRLVVGLLASLPLFTHAASQVDTEHLSATLVSEQRVLAPGQTHWVGVRFRLQPHWHIYWRNPGDSGYPPSFSWTLPPGVEAGDIRWPAPSRIPAGPLTNFGYEQEVLLAVPLSVPVDFRASQLPLKLAAEWLVCEEVCIPESGEFDLTLPVGSVSQPDPVQAPVFAATRTRWPAASPPAGWQISAAVDAGQVAVSLQTPADTPAIKSLVFFPFDEGRMQPAAPQGFSAQAPGYGLRLSGAEIPTGLWDTLHGVMVADTGAAVPLAFEVRAPIQGAALGAIRPANVSVTKSVPALAAQADPARQPAQVGVFYAALLAFLGGALLNLMPCVFPVLSIKLLSLARHAGEGADARRARASHAAFYTAGVVLSFVALAGLLLVLKAGGASLGWGFQLQSPVFVAALAVLFFGLGLSLSGALPIATLAQDVPGAWRLRHPHLDAFASGALAVLVASPCTAPLMGVALGAAFTMPAVKTLAVFAALGLGMAAPYALLAILPGALRRLPRPGAWMERLKEFLAFPLYATVVWLAWVLTTQAGADGALYLGVALLGVALFAWLIRLQARTWRLGGALLALAVVAYAVMALSGPQATGKLATMPAERWQPYTPEALQMARQQHRAVFVDFTAAWCVTCQVNKRLVLARDAVLADFDAAGVHLMRADWTLKDPAITQELQRLGRNGVPVYALYAGHGEPVLLPEVLSHDAIKTALAALPAPEKSP
ncbi:protein-disulfide reductase DsbD [Chitinimonas sp. BJYL2]|uniref:protein-disulfide reductase DsbD family protein n=1 Tax=Chitinimonas sp. BJYL2 TaxID=2976696 RepID=UPI0022B46D38|nr:protein-disulfide reductase DsbD domain-containing protein [Chitinimonas sp. BJYL2]